jgi:hypothetical protein
MATIYWALYPSAQADPVAADIIAGTVTNGIHGTDTSPVSTQAFAGTAISGLAASTSYKLASVWSDGTDNSNVIVSAAFTTLAATAAIEGTGSLVLGSLLSFAATGISSTAASASGLISFGAGVGISGSGEAYTVEGTAVPLSFGSFDLTGFGTTGNSVEGIGTLNFTGVNISGLGSSSSSAGTGVLLLGGFALSASASVSDAATASGSLAFSGITLNGSGQVVTPIITEEIDSLFSSFTLGGFAISGQSNVIDSVIGEGTLAFGGIVFSGTGNVERAAIGTGSFGFTGLVLAGSSNLTKTIEGSGSILFPTIALQGFGSSTAGIEGTGTVPFGTLQLRGLGIIEHDYVGVGGFSLGGLTIDGYGYITRAPVVVDPQEPSGKLCGTGLFGSGTLPGDPNLGNSVLSATGLVGAIGLSWIYPTINPHAVAHTLIYRSKQNDFDLAALIRTQSGDFYRDEAVEEGTRYYYWIRMVSVNGTTGEVIGPASAIPQLTIDELIGLLEQRISDSFLNQELRTQIAQITDLQSSLSIEEQERLFGDTIFTDMLESYRADLDDIDTLVRNEVIERITGDSALVAEVDLLLAKVNDSAAAILEESAVRATETDALALQITTLQASAGGDTAAVQELQQVVAGANGLSAQYMLKTDVNGYVSGFGLYNDGATSQFIVNVDDFAIGRPGENKFPFIIGQVNGTTQIALNARTLIPDAAIGIGQIERELVSSNYNPGSRGWRINSFTGTAEFQNVIARGDIEASSIKANSVNIVDTLMLQGEAVVVPRQDTGIWNGSLSSGWQTVCSYPFSLGSIGAGRSTRLIIMGHVTCYPGNTTFKTLEFRIATNGVTNVTAGLSIESGGVATGIVGGFNVGNNFSSTITLEVRCADGTKPITAVGSMVMFAGKR